MHLAPTTMHTPNKSACLFALLLALPLTGCGPSEEERIRRQVREERQQRADDGKEHGRELLTTMARDAWAQMVRARREGDEGLFADAKAGFLEPPTFAVTQLLAVLSDPKTSALDRELALEVFPEVVKSLPESQSKAAAHKIKRVREAIADETAKRLMDPVLIVAFDEALAVEPNDPVLLAHRGEAKRLEGNLDGALADYESALKVDQNPYLYLGRAVVYHMKLDWDRAIADYTTALELAPDEPNTLMLRGNAWAGKGDLEKGLADLSEALTINPQFARAYKLRADVYRQMGRDAEAADDEAKAAELSSQ